MEGEGLGRGVLECGVELQLEHTVWRRLVFVGPDYGFWEGQNPGVRNENGNALGYEGASRAGLDGSS